MAETLKDPGKPAHAIVEVYDDGSALRNDGKKLKSARKNPWYVLATLFGEHEAGDWKDDVVQQNRQAWNAWSGADMSDEERGALAEKIGLDVSDLEMPSLEYKNVLLRRFRDRMEVKTAQLPPSNERIDFSATYFETPIGFSNYVFTGPAVFHSTTFAGDAHFHSTTFAGDAYFHSTTFAGYTNYSSAKFRSTTDFSKVIFETHVPEFHAAELYADTTFELPDTAAEQRKHWPPVRGGQDPKVMPADKQKRAYNRLRLFMNQSLQTEEEQFFHRREMACKKELEGWFMFGVYWLYENLSDYGYSVARPLAGLFGNVLAGWLVFALVFFFKSQEVSGAAHSSAFGVSFSNVFAFLGFGRIFLQDFYRDMTEDYGACLVAFASLQTVFGFIFVFLLGLGLRSRFRLR